MTLLEQCKIALMAPDGGLVVNQWRPVVLTQGTQAARVEVFCAANTRASIRVRRPVKLASGRYYEIMRFNRKGELLSGPLVTV